MYPLVFSNSSSPLSSSAFSIKPSFVFCSISFQSSNPFTNPTHRSFKMRFFTAATFILAASAAPVDQSETSSGQIEKRLDPITISIISTVASAAAGWATTEGLNTLKGLIKDTSSWDKASFRPPLGHTCPKLGGEWSSDSRQQVREQFTQDAVARMAANYKADPSFKGAICYNMGYMVNDPAKRSDIVSLEVTSGKLKAELVSFLCLPNFTNRAICMMIRATLTSDSSSSYDCFYLKSGGEFKGNGDGGFINVCDSSRTQNCASCDINAHTAHRLPLTLITALAATLPPTCS